MKPDSRGLIYQTRDKLINKKLQLPNNIDNYNNGQKVTGMINHAPTDWIMMKKTEITLGRIVRYFKTGATKIIHNINIDNFKWQRSFYDRIIRNDKNNLKNA